MNPMNSNNQPGGILGALLASAILSGMNPPGSGRRAASEAKNIFDEMFGENNCGDPECIGCLVKAWTTKKMEDPEITVRDQKTYSRLLRVMEGVDQGLQKLSLKEHVYDKIIAFAEEHGFRNHAELVRICKSFAEKIVQYGHELEARGETTHTRVMPPDYTSASGTVADHKTSGETQQFSGGRPVEQDTRCDKAPTMDGAPAAAGVSPKRDRRKDEGPNSVTANH